jgi:hypothetical protein
MPVTEAELEERAVAPRVTLEQVRTSIVHEYFFTAADGVRAGQKVTGKMQGKAESLERLTFCVLVLRNGFTVIGKSACADPKNFQKDIGERIARDHAVRQIWELLGFQLCSKQTGELL